MNNQLSPIGFERLAAHAKMAFVLGYTYSGTLDKSAFSKAASLLYQNLYKTGFSYNLAGTKEFWQEQNKSDFTVVFDGPGDLKKALIKINEAALDLLGIPESPCGFAIKVVPNASKTQKERFLIAFIINHAFFDGRSAIHLYNNLLDLYNKIKTADLEGESATLAHIRNLSTISCADVISQLRGETQETESIPGTLHDIGPVAFEAPFMLPGERHSQSEDPPAVESLAQLYSFPLKSIFENKPDVSNNSLISALLCKCYSILTGREQFRFGMVAKVLSNRQQEQFIGNYMTNFPIEIDFANADTLETARAIHQQVQHARTEKDDHKLLLDGETLLSQPLAEIRDDNAFYITNWVNHAHLAQKISIAECELINCYGTLNTAPENKATASFFQRQGIIVCLSPDDVLNVGFTPAISMDQKPGKDLDISKLTDYFHAEIDALVEAIKESQKDFNFAKKITTKIYKEEACENNPYLAENAYIYGYELTRLVEKKSFTEVLFLLFRGEFPSEAQRKLLDKTCVALIHIGIRHPATRAAMIAGVGKTRPEHILPIGSLINGGTFDGANEVSQCIEFMTAHKDEQPGIVSARLLNNITSESGDLRIAPGFGSSFGSADAYCAKIAKSVWAGVKDSDIKIWAFEFVQELSKLDSTLGWTRASLAATVLLELGFNARESIGVYQLMTAPGLVAQGMEQTYNPIFNFPILQNDQYILKANDQDENK